MRCAIWYHLYNLKNLKNTHGGVLLLIKLLKVTFLHGYFLRFLNCANGTKSCDVSQMIFSHTCMHWCKLTGITFFIQSLMFCDVKKWESPFLSTWILRKSSSKIGQIAFVGWVIYMGPSYPHISVKYGNAPQWSKSTKPIAISTFFKNVFQFYNLIINKLDSKKHLQRIPKPISGHNHLNLNCRAKKKKWWSA